MTGEERRKAKAALHQHIVYDRRGRWIWTGPLNQENGYPRLSFGSETVYAHRLCHEIYIGPVPPEKEVHHIDGNRLNISPCNIQAVTRKQNAELADYTKRKFSYLSQETARTIKILAAAEIPLKVISEIFKIPVKTVASISTAHRWAWLKVPGC